MQRFLATIFFASLCLCLFLTGCSSSTKNELRLFTWGGFIKPEIIASFEEKFHCKVIYDTYDSNESMYAKLKLGGTGYDIVVPSNYYLEIMVQQGMVQSLSMESLPNSKALDETYSKLYSESLKDFGIPFKLSFTGLGYRNDKVSSIDTSWNIFAQNRWRGRMTMLNDLREVIGAALMHLGYDVNTIEPAEINQAADLAILWKSHLAKYESEQYKNGLASAEYLIVQGYSGDILQIMEENAHVSFVYPKEGPLASCDYLALLKDAPNPELAHAFINYMYEPEVTAENISYTYFLTPNSAAYEMLTEDLHHNQILFPPQESLQKTQLIRNIGPAIELYNHAWDRIKAS